MKTAITIFCIGSLILCGCVRNYTGKTPDGLRTFERADEIRTLSVAPTGGAASGGITGFGVLITSRRSDRIEVVESDCRYSDDRVAASGIVPSLLRHPSSVALNVYPAYLYPDGKERDDSGVKAIRSSRMSLLLVYRVGDAEYRENIVFMIESRLESFDFLAPFKMSGS
jgi:hypothetical protein